MEAPTSTRPGYRQNARAASGERGGDVPHHLLSAAGREARRDRRAGVAGEPEVGREERLARDAVHLDHARHAVGHELAAEAERKVVVQEVGPDEADVDVARVALVDLGAVLPEALVAEVE